MLVYFHFYTFNNDKLENDYNDIYPDELKHKLENEDPYEASFYYLSIEVHDWKFATKLFDKKCLSFLHWSYALFG